MAHGKNNAMSAKKGLLPKIMDDLIEEVSKTRREVDLKQVCMQLTVA